MLVLFFSHVSGNIIFEHVFLWKEQNQPQILTFIKMDFHLSDFLVCDKASNKKCLPIISTDPM